MRWSSPLKQRRHLYIYQVDTRGELIPLFPNPEISNIRKTPSRRGGSISLPSPGQWFYLDANTGREHFIVMSKKAPSGRAGPDVQGHPEWGISGRAVG